jgi:hypothetical protein
MNPETKPHMKKPRFQIALVCAAFIFGAATVHAQATRTWVSGVGDDVNPCSRTAPCKTFAGAISKTAEGGEIDALDPAGYGTLTITKAITIDGGTGEGWASVLNAGGIAGFTVNVTTGTHVSDAVVILRNITINGAIQAPTLGGTNGINYIKAAQLMVEKCYIEDQSTTGINQSSTATTTNLRVSDCNFDNMTTGILVNTSSGAAIANIDNCRFNGTANGLNTTANAFVTVRNCNFAATNGGNGAARAATGCQVNVANSMFSNNVLGAVVSGGTMRLSNNDFFNNTTAISGTAESANNNRFRGNTTDGTVSNVIVVK